MKDKQQRIQGILSEDKNAFDTLFKSYYGKLVLIANSILHDKQLSEEAVQDVFVKLWEMAPNLTIEKSVGTYLAKMVHNRSIDYLRANERRIQTVSIEDREIQAKLHELGHISFEDELFSDHLEVALKQALEQLPPQCRQIFILNRFDGYSPREISEILQVSVSTVKTQITRALQKLKSGLSPLLGEAKDASPSDRVEQNKL